MNFPFIKSIMLKSERQAGDKLIILMIFNKAIKIKQDIIN